MRLRQVIRSWKIPLESVFPNDLSHTHELSLSRHLAIDLNGSRSVYALLKWVSSMARKIIFTLFLTVLVGVGNIAAQNVIRIGKLLAIWSHFTCKIGCDSCAKYKKELELNVPCRRSMSIRPG